MKSLVIIPTYNECENVKILIPEILNLPHDIEVLVVDDNSPDGTAAVVSKMAKEDGRINLLKREKKLGLGSAYVEGFKYALSRSEIDCVFEMDADFSHDPASIPDFLSAIEKCDLVLGSRYLDGVTVVNWPLSRLILSYSANLYTRIVTGLPVHDATGGFKCFHRRVLESIDLDSVHSDGYSFQIEMSFKCWRNGFKIKEIPITFVDRRVGTSKMSQKIVWEAVWLVWRLRWQSLFRRRRLRSRR
ncbi:MAG: dolichyl-phosphate beta-D-mannosyltransferase [Latescibacteria bacterium DG_63]|nr:MAG: dolichyl-phosphate beta-D-mannosyltransferase [Latescibacteria bacterium DG_63]